MIIFYMKTDRSTTVKSSINLKTLYFILFFGSLPLIGYSYNYTSASSSFIRSNWNSASTWNGTIAPSSGLAMNMSIDISGASPYQSIKLDGDLILNNNNQLTVSAGDTLIVNNLTISGGSNVYIYGFLIVTGNLINN